MPLKSSSVIAVASASGSRQQPYSVRTHYIAVYPAESARIMARIKKER